MTNLKLTIGTPVFTAGSSNYAVSLKTSVILLRGLMGHFPFLFLLPRLSSKTFWRRWRNVTVFIANYLHHLRPESKNDFGMWINQNSGPCSSTEPFIKDSSNKTTWQSCFLLSNNLPKIFWLAGNYMCNCTCVPDIYSNTGVPTNPFVVHTTC